MSTAEGTRRCPRCRESKPYVNFYRRKTGKYKGMHYGYCKPCQSEYQKWRYANIPEVRETILERNHEFYSENPEHCRALTQRWREKNRKRYLVVMLSHWYRRGRKLHAIRRANRTEAEHKIVLAKWRAQYARRKLS